MITSAVVHDWRKRAKRNEEAQIEIRVTIDRKTNYIPTGIKVLKSEFLAGVVVDRPDADELNKRIGIIHKRAMQELNYCLDNGMEIDMATLKKRVWNGSSITTTMLDWIREQVGMLNVEVGTLRHYETLLLRLSEYGMLTRWQDLTVENLYKWDAWLHQLPGRNGQKIGDATVYNYHKCLKALIYRAVKMEIIQSNPYDKLRGEFKRGERDTVEYLTEAEMQRIEALDIPDGTALAVARDLFMFQMYTGLSYSDTQAFDFKNYRLEKGMWTSIQERIKTGVPFVSRLLPPVIRVLEKYKWRVPKMNNADYNRHLKGIGVAAGIHVKLHSHMARHTFATYMLANGVSLDSVSVMVGHTNTVQTRRYAKTLASTVRDDFDMIAAKLNK